MPQLSELQRKLLAEIKKDPTLTNKQYAKLIGSTDSSTQDMIAKLVARGYIVKQDLRRGEHRKPLELVGNIVEQPPKVNDILHAEKMELQILDKLKKALKEGSRKTIQELSDILNTGVSNVKANIVKLKESGYNVTEDNDEYFISTIIPKSAPTNLSISKMATGFYKIGFCGDSHLCSKYERMDILNALYDYYEEQGITTVYNTGNWIDGEARFNKHDIHTHGLDNQIDYFIKNYPKRNGITTYFITGDDHEGWYTQREGIDVGYYTQIKAQKAGRNDLIYIGHMEADVIINAPNGKTIIRVQHPGGGSSYAISYTSQKIVESFSGNEKPDILAIGHYHKAEYLFVRGVHTVQTACTMDQSPFMRKKRLAAHLGGWVVDFATDDNGAVIKFKPEYLPFFDKDYYKKWAYQWGDGK